MVESQLIGPVIFLLVANIFTAQCSQREDQLTPFGQNNSRYKGALGCVTLIIYDTFTTVIANSIVNAADHFDYSTIDFLADSDS